jgi:hypothetical protein
MIHLILVSLISVLVSFTSFAAPAEKWVAEKASFNFDTFIRVKIPAQVVEAEDTRIVGETTAFIQSLLYTANKSAEFQGIFNSESEVKSVILKDLCPSEHEVELLPMRHEGSKGDRGFKSKNKPFTVSVTGKIVRSETVKPFTVFTVCGKRI